MTVPTWGRDTLAYDLSDGYSLVKSEPIEWGVHFSVYYNMEYNGFWKNNGYDVRSDKAYMIYHDNVRIGGVCIAPNVIYHLFFIPPFSQKFEVLGLLKELLLTWSDPTKPIRAIEILPDQIDMYSMFGFQPNEFRNRWMQRPTAKFEVDWEDTHVDVKTPKFDPSSLEKRLVQESDLNRLFYFAYTQGIEDIRRNRNTEEDHREAYHFASETNESLLEASTLVYDKQSNQLIGACLISLQGETPAVFNIAVLPIHRRGGLATNMLKHALNVLQSDYPILRLYVMQGNEAEWVYYNLGFQPGLLEVQQCSIPASVSEVSD